MGSLAAILGAGTGFFFGTWDGFLYALVMFICIDYLTGVARAIVLKNLSSHIGLQGIVRKGLIFLLVGMAHTLDVYVLGGVNAPIRNAVIFFFIGNEGISILENTASLGLPIPSKLKDILLRMKESGENTQ
jgi:toxin secretion/phage lysis holin